MEKPVYFEKPSQVIEKIVEKIVYVDKKVDSSTSSEHVDKPAVINKLFDDILVSDEDVSFRLFLVQKVHYIYSGLSHYREIGLRRCNSPVLSVP